MNLNSLREYYESEIWSKLKQKWSKENLVCKACGKPAEIFKLQKYTAYEMNGNCRPLCLCKKHQYHNVDEKGQVRKRSPYTVRNEILTNLGLGSYKEYLKTQLWSSIRERVLKKYNYKCRVCGEATNTVHHIAYNEDIMLGISIDDLIVLCKTHHMLVEFDVINDNRDKKSNLKKNSINKAKVKLGKFIGKKCRFCNRKLYSNDVCSTCKRKHHSFLLDESFAYKH
jgi:hypothetical protein